MCDVKSGLLVFRNLGSVRLRSQLGRVVVEVGDSDGHIGGGSVARVRILSDHCQVEKLLVGLFIVHLLC